MDFRTRTLVIARNDEDITWAKDKNHVVIQKGHHLPNIGREISSWFYFILTNYETLEGDYVFCQGHPFDHAPNITDGVEHRSKPNGAPDHSGLDIHRIAAELDLPILDEYVFLAGAQHETSAEQIKRRPYEWYAKAFLLSLDEKNQVPWIFERLIPYIYVV